MKYDNRGQVSLWKRKADAAPGAPALKGTAVAHRDIREGEELDIALWRNDSQNPKAPMMTGKLQDKYEPKQQQAAPQPDPEPFNDDLDIPF